MQPGIERVAVTVGGHQIVVDSQLRADGPTPVLFLHGLLTSCHIVRRLFDAPDSESWVSVSLPGHHPGRLATGTAPESLDADLFADLVDAALERVLGGRNVVATGWSTGGFAALNLAIRKPARVAAVASFAGFASGQRISGSIAWLAWLARRPAGKPLVRGGLWAGGRMPWLHNMFLRTAAADSAAARGIDRETLADLGREFSLHDPVALTTVLSALATLDLAGRLEEISVPAWIAAGGRDPLVPLDEAIRLSTCIPGSQLTVYEGGGHLFFHEWPGFRGDFAAWRAGLPAAAS